MIMGECRELEGSCGKYKSMALVAEGKGGEWLESMDIGIKQQQTDSKQHLSEILSCAAVVKYCLPEPCWGRLGVNNEVGHPFSKLNLKEGPSRNLSG